MGLKQDLLTKTRCDACLIKFEPKTRMVESKEGGRIMVYHVGCWARITRALRD